MVYTWFINSGFHIIGCPGQPSVPVGQPDVDLWLPDGATKIVGLILYIYVVGQPKTSCQIKKIWCWLRSRATVL